LGDFNKLSTNAPSIANASAPRDDFEDELAKELAKGMDDLLKEMGADPKLKQEMEMLLSGTIPGVAKPSSVPKPPGPKSSKDRIEEIQSKLRDSSEKVGVRFFE
jgi:hypothetical protein